MAQSLKKSLSLVLFILSTTFVYSQWMNNNWILGANQILWDTTDYAVMRLDFTNGTPVAYKLQPMNFYADLANGSICDSTGQIVCYTNGIQVKNQFHEVVENGDKLNIFGGTSTYPLPQGTFFLPRPESINQILLFHQDVFYFYYPADTNIHLGGLNLTYSIVDINKNNGHGKVILRKKLLIQDTLSGGQLTAVKHANGRDWWILASRDRRNEYLRFLATPTNVYYVGIQILNSPIYTNLGQAVFSPDGNWYLRYNVTGDTVGGWLDIYNFDRCDGLLSNHHHIHMNAEAKWGGVAVSSNSRFAYAAASDSIFQFDLQANDIEASKVTVAAYDGFHENVGTSTNPYYVPTDFFMMQIGPDKKIYCNSATNSCSYFHVISQPDSAGLACNVLQHALKLPATNNSIPGIPNYYLGTEKGSICDSLSVSVNNMVPITALSVSIQPNPATDKAIIYFSNPLNCRITIYDCYGKNILNLKETSTLVESCELDTSNLKSGLYFVSIDSKTTSRKILKLAVVH